MTDNWDRTLFDKDLKAILEGKLPVSASKITHLQNLATTHPKHHNYIIQCITRFIETAPPDYRLAGLYVIDAITRHVHKQQKKREENNQGGGPTEADGYLKRFAFVLKDDALNGCFEPCTEKDKVKVKKTLEIWEQSEFYPKDVVQYIKKSFLDSQSLVKGGRNEKGITAPPVDTAMLLATLSNIGNGTLANLNIPGLTPTPPSVVAATAPQQQESSGAEFPPDLTKLLGRLIPTPSPPVAAPSPPSDPRMRANDPRQRNWPVPQGPSIPQTSISTRASGERKSRWGNANDTTTINNNYSQQPPQQQQVQQIQQQQQQQNDPWSQRQAIQDPRVALNIDNNYNQMAQPAPPSRSNQSYSPQQQQQHQQAYPQYQQPHLAYSSYQQQQPMYNQQTPPQQQRERGEDPFHEPTLPGGCIKVLTRTLYVGPIPDHYEKEDVGQIFSKYGELASIIVSKKYKGKHSAFLKYITRLATETAKMDSLGLAIEGIPVKVNWAFGFGPKKHFNYDRGDSIIPLNELSPDEKETLMHAPVGGFQGQPVREQMTVEEPEAQYRPEWKNDDPRGGPGGGGQKRSGANFEEVNTSRKRNRFTGNDDGGYDMMSPPRHQPMHHSRFDESSQGSSIIVNNSRGQPRQMFQQQQQQQQQQDYYFQQQEQRQQQYDPSIPVNPYGDYQQ